MGFSQSLASVAVAAAAAAASLWSKKKLTTTTTVDVATATYSHWIQNQSKQQPKEEPLTVCPS